MTRASGTFMAKMWGIQFAVAAAILASACTPADGATPLGADCSTITSRAGRIRSALGGVGADPDAKVFASALAARLSNLSGADRLDAKARFAAISGAIGDAAIRRGVSADPEQENLRIQIALSGDLHPELLGQPQFRRLVDSVQQLPGVLEKVTKVRSAISQGRAWWAAVHGQRHGASLMIVNDTVAAVGTLMGISDAVGIGDSTSTNWDVTNLGDPALADGLSSYAFDSTFAAGLTGSNAFASNLRPYLFSAMFTLWMDGGGPAFSMSAGCSGGVAPTHATPATVTCCIPDWIAHATIAGVITTVIGIASRVETGVKTLSIYASEDVAAGLAEVGITVASDFAVGFFASILESLAFLLLFDVHRHALPVRQ